MKKKLSIAAILLFISIVSLAQPDPGGYADGGPGPDGEPKSQPSPVFFKRNNGNGTCGGEAQIRLYFKVRPDYLPTMQGIFYEGTAIQVNIHPIDTSMLSKKGYASYCIQNTNIPPACKLILKFNYHDRTRHFSWKNTG